MARSIDDLERELMALPEQERARVALDLIRSLDEDDEPLSREEWDAAWREEIQRRVQDVHDGCVELVDANRAMAALKEHYPGR